MRSVERKVLLESLAAELPAGTIRFKSHVEGIEQSKTSPGVTDIHLRDGSMYSAQVLTTINLSIVTVYHVVAAQIIQE